MKYFISNVGIKLLKDQSSFRYPPLGLRVGAASIRSIYKIPITNILEPAIAAKFLSGLSPLLATQQKNKNTQSVAN